MQAQIQTAEEIESCDDVVRAVGTWESCDVAVLVDAGTDIGPIRRGFDVVEITECSAAPYILLELDHN